METATKYWQRSWKLEIHGPTEIWRKMCHCTSRCKICTFELWVNLFSISKDLKHWFIGNEDVVVKLMKGNTTLFFDRILKTKNGFVLGIKLCYRSLEILQPQC
jgi:hypothetical protein